MSVVEVSVSDGICWIRLNRPDLLNAWSVEMGEEVTRALDAADSDEAVRVVVLTGAGKGFCSGGDLRGSFQPDRVNDLRGLHHRGFVPAILALRRLSKPVIAAVNGVAAGYGCSVLLACDFVLMARSAKLIFAFSRIGLMPDGGATAMLTERVGRLRATEIAMLARDIDAQRAASDGLVTRVVDDEQLLAETSQLAEELACGPTRAFAAIKRAMHRWSLEDLARHMQLEGDLLQALSSSKDFAEGTAAFGQKRKASFIGR